MSRFVFPSSRRLSALVIGCVCIFGWFSGCSELRGRRRIREGNRLYRSGNYAAALEEYRLAESLAPQVPLLWLNEGLTCRQMMISGGKSSESKSESRRAADCAIAAFRRLTDVDPRDPRGDQLYVQTLFDSGGFDILEARYKDQVTKSSSDLAAINGLIQVYTRASRPELALASYERKAALLPKDSQAQYAVGVFAWQQLFQRGGGPDKASFDPRPAPSDTAPAVPRGKHKRRRAAVPEKSPGKIAPPFAVGDLTGTARVKVAEIGIKYLENAVALRPDYREATIYLGLLYRQKSMAYFDDPAAWQVAVDAAERWRRKAGGEPSQGSDPHSANSFGAGQKGTAPAAP